MTIGIFRRGGGISQRRPIFVTKGHFHSCEMRAWGCKMALVCQRWVSQLRNEAWAAKSHSCAKGRFRSCENFRRGGLWGCEIVSQRRAYFAANPWFRSESLLDAKLFRRGGPFSQGGSFGLRNLAGLYNYLLLILFGSLRPSFTSFVIPPKLDHSKSLSYLKIT